MKILKINQGKWYALFVIIIMYLPVSIDATILHVTAPTLAAELNASTDEILWIIDIYSLVMACFLLPMGVLGDRAGARKIALIGIYIFGVASFLAMLSDTALMLIIARGILAVGAAMILPATLSILRLSFKSSKERAIALGIWSAIGTGGAAIGPLAGGLLLENYSWSAVFFINIPVCVIVFILTLRLPSMKKNTIKRKIPFTDAVLLMTAILLLILSLKSVATQGINISVIGFMVTGILTLWYFIHRQMTSRNPMLELSLFRNRIIIAGIILALASMVSLVGFEFFVSQQLQLAYGRTPLQAGLFLMPLILASCLSGPFIGWALDILGVRIIATGGVFFSALCFAGLACTDFSNQAWAAWGYMIILGFCIEAALLASTNAIMNAAPEHKAAEAGAIEGMAYEMGSGLGVVLFGLLMSWSFTKNIMQFSDLPEGINLADAGKSLSEALSHAQTLSYVDGQIIREAAILAFLNSHSTIMFTSAICLLILSVNVFILLKHSKKDSIHHI